MRNIVRVIIIVSLFISSFALAENVFVGQGQTLGEACEVAEARASAWFELNREITSEVCPQVCDDDACQRTGSNSWSCPTKPASPDICLIDADLS